VQPLARAPPEKGTRFAIDVEGMVGLLVGHRPHLHYDVIPAKAGIHPEMLPPSVGVD
jgi:hypothetical protein